MIERKTFEQEVAKYKWEVRHRKLINCTRITELRHVDKILNVSGKTKQKQI